MVNSSAGAERQPHRFHFLSKRREVALPPSIAKPWSYQSLDARRGNAAQVPVPLRAAEFENLLSYIKSTRPLRLTFLRPAADPLPAVDVTASRSWKWMIIVLECWH